jgi:hypothetical protein
MSLADELERLAGEATPGPWRVGLWGNGEHVPGLEHIFLDSIESTIQDVLAEDAALIVALRNALPTILSALREREAIASWVNEWRPELADAIRAGEHMKEQG